MRYSVMKSIVFAHTAARDFDGLDTAAQDQVGAGLDDYALHGRGDVKRLSGRAGFRLRIGRYRVIFGDDGQTILAVYIGKRETTTYGRH